MRTTIAHLAAALFISVAAALPAIAQNEQPPSGQSGQSGQPGQQTPIPDTELTGPYTEPEPVRLGPYITTGAVEFGWRFTDLDGSRDGYRAVVDLPRGPYLAFSRVELRSPDNSGFLFDHLLVEGSGLGEQVSSGRVRIAKRRIYIVDYRRSRIETYNYVPDFANPLFDDGVLVAPHGWDRARDLDTLDVVVAPERRIEGQFTWTRTRQSGLGLGTDISNDALVFTRKLDNTANDVRGRVSLRWPRWFLALETGGRLYSDDERSAADSGTVLDPQTLAAFSRTRTTNANAPTTRAVFTASPLARLKLTARAVYTDYNVTAGLRETNDALGSDPTATVADGRTEGHAFLFDASQEVRVLDWLRVSNAIRYRRYRTVGATASVITTNDDAANAITEAGDRSLRDARLSDEVTVQADATRTISTRIGYRFARREYAQSRRDRFLFAPPNEEFSTERFLARDDTQRLDVFFANASYRMRHDARLFVEFENGREAGPSFGFDERGVFYDRPGDYQLARVRGAWEPFDCLELGGSIRVTDRTFKSGVTPGRAVVVDDPDNPVFVRLFDGEPPLQFTRSRAASLTVRVRPTAWVNFGATYDHVHNTASLDYLDAVEGPPASDGSTPILNVFRSLRYLDDEELVTADLWVRPVDRLTFTALYSLVNTSGAIPLHYHQAQARGAYTFGRGVSGFVEWRIYDYDDHRFSVADFQSNHAMIGLRMEW